jgi:hypothetical protein
VAKRQRRKIGLAFEATIHLCDRSTRGRFYSSADQSGRVGELEDFEIPELKPEAALEHLPEVPAPD